MMGKLGTECMCYSVFCEFKTVLKNKDDLK